MSETGPLDQPVPVPPRSAQGTVRRLIVTTILFVLVVITATGVSGLLGRLFETRPDLAAGTGGLALSLAFTLVGGPLAIVLWWFVWRRLEGPDRSSVAWGLYIAAIATVALVTFSASLLGMFADLLRGSWSPDALATGITWLVVWILHRVMWAHARKRPLRLTTVPIVLGAAYGLVVAASGAIRALQALFGDALLPGAAQIGASWWQSALQALVWAIGGATIWWWHWVHDRALVLQSGFSAVALVVVGVLGGAVVTLGAVGSAVFVGLRAAFDRSEPWRELLDPLPLAVAAAAVGAVVWRYHRGVARERSARTRSATGLVEAGIGLVAAASGIGVVVNALLAALTTPLAGSGTRALLLGGIASLVVGAPLWWKTWRPTHSAADAGTTGRRVYLVAVFGVSAVVAIVALLVIGFRIFELTLGGGAGDTLVERIRAPFGLLLATALAAGYHFAIWRRDRAATPAAGRTRAIDRVILVSGGDPAALAQAIEAATGASVTRWMRADASETVAPTDAVLRALEQVTARRVLLVTGPGERVETIPLAD